MNQYLNEVHAKCVKTLDECIENAGIKDDSDDVSLDTFTNKIKSLSWSACNEYYGDVTSDTGDKSCKEYLEEIIKVAKAAIVFQDNFGF